jgi:hypothetical protein
MNSEPIGCAQSAAGLLRANRSFDADTQRHCAASRAREHTFRGAMQLRAGHLQR